MDFPPRAIALNHSKNALSRVGTAYQELSNWDKPYMKTYPRETYPHKNGERGNEKFILQFTLPVSSG
jgi:hypothetical protein